MKIRYIVRETLQDRYGSNTHDVSVKGTRLIYDTKLEAESAALRMQRGVDRAYTKYGVEPILA